MAKTHPQGVKKERITWHTAFFDAIRLELEDYLPGLTFSFELPLGAEPLRIDAVILKEPDLRIDKAIGWIFRRVNVIEYKSPEDTLTIGDFHKVAAYARLYLSQYDAAMTDIAISFIVSRRPRELLRELTALEYGITQAYPGIYHIAGEKHIPVQIAVAPELAEAEYLWLRSLTNKLNREGMGRIIREGGLRVKSPHIKVYLYQVFQANPEMLKELLIMERATVDQILEEIGWSAERRAEGRTQGKKEERRSVLELINRGYTLEQLKQALTAEVTE
ncbi:MAG: hypothetical protein LBG73_01035 [Spirochaetaceae bacterium]|jgi:hypothetical protein|nr:hypothetical protein [Spirochaetaceae bacterium]